MDRQAINEYVEAWDGGFDAKKKRDLAERARKQLLAMGWRLWYTPKGTRFEARYDSPEPEKKTYASLVTACRAAQASSIQQQESRNLKRKRSNSFAVQPKKRKDSSEVRVVRSSKNSLVLRIRKRKRSMDNDEICSVCHNDGELVLCDGCPASFHTNCLNMLDVPDGDWFCPSCRCAICDSSDNQTTHNCAQCERLFHVNCLGGVECPKGKWFCSTACDKIHRGLESLQRKTIPLQDDLTWTLIKPISAHDKTHLSIKAECHTKLSRAIKVMHECFDPVKDPLTGRDLVEDVIFGTRSELKRLSFTGFYTVLLEKKGDLASAATVRIYGKKVAEVPLVATRFKYRRQGMCRFLMNALEKMLTEIGVERLVLPAVSSVVNTWTALGFTVMTPTERSEFLGYTFLDFPHTVMCHKLMKKSVLSPSSIPTSCHHEVREIVDELDQKSPISEVCQGAQTELYNSVDQDIVGIPKDNHNNGCKDPSSDVMEITPSNQQCSTTENNPEAREIKDDRLSYRNPYKFKGEIKQYRRRKAVCKTAVSCI